MLQPTDVITTTWPCHDHTQEDVAGAMLNRGMGDLYWPRFITLLAMRPRQAKAKAKRKPKVKVASPEGEIAKGRAMNAADAYVFTARSLTMDSRVNWLHRAFRRFPQLKELAAEAPGEVIPFLVERLHIDPELRKGLDVESVEHFTEAREGAGVAAHAAILLAVMWGEAAPLLAEDILKAAESNTPETIKLHSHERGGEGE